MRRPELLEATVWAVVLFAAYLAIISTISVTEIVVGAVTGVASGVAAVLTRRTLLSGDDEGAYRPHARWFRWLLRVPDQTVAGFARLLARPSGEFTELRLPADERPAARRGYAALALSLTPSTYVADLDPERHTLLVHRIGDRPSALEREVAR
jgi:multisubunit Na+/H+ antiporter MnhE subunit